MTDTSGIATARQPWLILTTVKINNDEQMARIVSWDFATLAEMREKYVELLSQGTHYLIAMPDWVEVDNVPESEAAKLILES